MRPFADFWNELTDEQRIAEIKAGDLRMSDVEAGQYLKALRQRFDEKERMLERGMSNQLAERYLDRKGWPRSYGSHTVFFYPGSNKMRTRYIVFFALAAVVIYWIAN